MAMSGIDVAKETLAIFGNMKIRDKKKKKEEIKNEEEDAKPIQLMVLEIDEDMVKVKPELCREMCTNDEFRDFLGDHPDQPYYVIYDFIVREKPSITRRLMGVAWIPDGSPVSKRMKYASTFEGIKGKFEGCKWAGVAHETSDCDDKEIIHRI